MQVAIDLVGSMLCPREYRALRDGAQHAIAEATEGTAHGQEAHAIGRRVSAHDRQGHDSAHNDRGPIAECMAEDERRTEESRVGEDHRGRRLAVGRHHGLVLVSRRTDEEVLYVEGDRLGPFESGSLGEHLVRITLIVEGRFRREREMSRPGSLYGTGKPAPRDEPDVVAPFHELPATGSSGPTWPCAGTVAIRIDDIVHLLW